MLVAYLDESGDTGVLPHATSDVQPAFCLIALAVPTTEKRHLTLEFLKLKRAFFPGFVPPSLNGLLVELKGAEIRATFRGNNKSKQAHHAKFLDRLLDLVEQHHCKLFGRIWIKPIGGPFDGHPIYTSSAQSICETFHQLLDTQKKMGFVIGDFRTQALNSKVSFSIFTQRYSVHGNPYHNVVETPVFGHSENHAVLQICDLICSALIFPITTYSYCLGHVTSVHVSPSYAFLKNRYAHRLQKLEFRYQRQSGKFAGGLVISDPIAGRGAKTFFY